MDTDAKFVKGFVNEPKPMMGQTGAQPQGELGELPPKNNRPVASRIHVSGGIEVSPVNSVTIRRHKRAGLETRTTRVQPRRKKQSGMQPRPANMSH